MTSPRHRRHGQRQQNRPFLLSPLPGCSALLLSLSLSLLSLLLLSFSADTVVEATGDQTSDLPLFATSTVDCDEMITLHRWEGDCCSLNATTGGGCILNVMDGRCRVYGQVWTLDYSSTYDDKPCPAGEYTWQDLGMKSDPNAVPDDGSGAGARVVGGRGLAGVLAGAAALALWAPGLVGGL